MFASDLGWKPGYWPMSFTYAKKEWKRQDAVRSSGEFRGFVYECDGIKMTVFND